MTMLSASCSLTRAESVDQAVQTISSVRYNVIVVHITLSTLKRSLAAAMVNASLTQDDKLIIFSDFDRPPSEEEFQANADLKEVFRGSFRVSTQTMYAKEYEKYLSMWTTEFATNESIAYINQFLPPRGLRNNFDLAALDTKDWAYTLNIPSKEFFTYTRSFADVVWARAYDAVIALALASCNLTASGEIAQGKALYERLVNVKFNGLSGPVGFAPNGDRDYQNFLFLLQNWNHTTRRMIAMYNTTRSNFSFIYRPMFRGLNKPLEITPPENVYQALPVGVQILGYIEIAVVNILCLICFGWVYVNRNHKVVIASQRTFLNLIILGCLVCSWSTLPLSFDDVDFDGDLDPACMAFPYLYSIGYVLAMVSLIAKEIRVFSIFQRTSSNHHKGGRMGIRIPVMLLFILAFLAVDVALLVTWSTTNPLVWTRVERVVDKNGFPLLTYGACLPRQDGTSQALAVPITLLVFHLAILVAVGCFNIKIKRFPQEFQEARYVALVVTGLAQLYLLGVPVFVAIVQNPLARFIDLSSIVFLTCCIILACIFLPKMDQVRRNLQFRSWQLENDGKPVEVSFVDGIRNNFVRDKFEVFAEKNLVIESFYFYLDVEAFKANPLTTSGKIDIQKARDFYEIYICEGGLLQVNISSKVREKIAQSVAAFTHSKKVDVMTLEGSSMGKHQQPMDDIALQRDFASIFNAAQEEIVSLLDMGAWRAFVEEGGMYRPGDTMFSRQASSSQSPSKTPRKSRDQGMMTGSEDGAGKQGRGSQYEVRHDEDGRCK